MKELDFDELDRAVNSLMTDVPKKTDTPQDNEVKTVTLSPSPASNGEAASSTPDAAVPATNPTSTSSPVPSVASRRGGRFMDVVHPASNMKKAESTRPVSRQGVTIAPSRAADEVAKSVTSSPSAEQKKPEVPIASEPSSPASEWPDPLELADFKDEPTAKKTDISSDRPDVDSPPETPEEPSPLTSPFLPDTKVEKRPLGGIATFQEVALPTAAQEDADKEDLTVNNPNAQLPAAPLDVESPLPEELQGDLVAIESGASGSASPAAEIPKEETPPASQPKSKLEALLPETTTPEPKEKERPPASTGPISIPQQYREEPSTGDQASGSIYDTDTYHQPLAHPGKKNSGWLWVIWIVLILIVGGGVGAALYFLGIV